jgi:hypothetical protein
MKRMIGILCMFLLLLTSCVQPATQRRETQLEGRVEEEKKVESLESIIASVKETTEAENVVSEELVLPVNSKTGKIDEFVVFGINFNQVNKLPATYFGEISFVEARDKNNNKIEVDRNVLNTWPNPSKTENFVLDKGESAFVPMVIKIGSEIKPGVATSPGIYQFEIVFFEDEGEGFFDELETLRKSVYVRVD